MQFCLCRTELKGNDLSSFQIKSCQRKIISNWQLAMETIPHCNVLSPLKCLTVFIIVGLLICMVKMTPGSGFLNRMALACSFSVQTYKAE